METTKQQLAKMIDYLKPQMEFLNCHMVDYLTKNHWQTYVPVEIRKELKDSQDLLEAKQMFWNQNMLDLSGSLKFPSLAKHLTMTKQYRLDALPGIVMSIEELKSAFDSCLKETRLKVPDLMSVKKRHEVEIASEAVASLCTIVAGSIPSENLDHVAVIDAGDGKGYLSSRVALEHGIKVLGIDSNMGNTINAEKRRDRLKKKIAVAIKKSDFTDDDHFINLLQENGSEPRYKTTNKLIDSDTNLIQLVKEKFPESDVSHFCLAGLHTCGNLGPNCLRLFHENRYIHALCNVGCCYHLLVEEFVVDKYYNQERLKENSGFGFPMSEFLREKGFFLGRNVRNMAGESIDRSIFYSEEPNDKLGYRAMLQVILAEQNADVDSQVGKLKCTNFVDYARKSLKRLKIDNIHLSDDFLNELENKFELELEQLKVYYLYRMTYAPIVEGVILLDRILYLKECGYENSFLVKLFDPVVSPRCYSILAFK
ncbi:probable methyltransferase-like protein 25 [Toxorhynchites rutilus septentrionalis]|uniref:probable methyltransferase-like protein 25 n=1 Tax=Toxorhynchites rutilus septentrionalis TaxID=329112 RepID=UPI0024784CE7|nr:probable methyltransferase-like protein 25 [Toxorhynchites rutilus septentrionalis]